MITVALTTNASGSVRLEFNDIIELFPVTSTASYSPGTKTLILESQGIDPNRITFTEAKYQFTIDGVLWAGTFEQLCDELNNTVFNSGGVSPVPGVPIVIRANAILTGNYVASIAFEVTGKSRVHLDFDITNGGALANSGCVIALIEVSDDKSSWKLLNNLVPATSLVSDGGPTPYESGTVFRQFTAEYGPTAIPYVSGGLPSAPIRISYAAGYGRYYRVKVRASDTGGISTSAPGTFPDLEITATLQ